MRSMCKVRLDSSNIYVHALLVDFIIKCHMITVDPIVNNNDANWDMRMTCRKT